MKGKDLSPSKDNVFSISSARNTKACKQPIPPTPSLIFKGYSDILDMNLTILVDKDMQECECHILLAVTAFYTNEERESIAEVFTGTLATEVDNFTASLEEGMLLEDISYALLAEFENLRAKLKLVPTDTASYKGPANDS